MLLQQEILVLQEMNPLQLTVSGQAKKLSRVGDENFSLPGSLQSASATRTPTKSLLDVEVDGSDVSNLATTLSVQNNINGLLMNTTGKFVCNLSK